MTFRKKLTQSFFIILSVQTLLGIGLTYVSVANLLKSQNRTILEEGWNQQNGRFNEVFKQSNKDLYFYKYLIESEISVAEGQSTLIQKELLGPLLSKCLSNTVAHTVSLYNSTGDLVLSRNSGAVYDEFSIQESPYSLYDFRFPSTKISWSSKESQDNYFGMVSGTRIIAEDVIFYLIFFTDFRQYLKQISERQPEVLTVISLPDRILYSDFPEVRPFAGNEGPWSEVRIGNDTFLTYGDVVWNKDGDLVTLSVLHSITAVKALLNRLVRITLIVFGFSWIIALIIAVWVSRIFSTPLNKLNNSLETYLEKGYFPQINYRGEQDLSFLISTFQGLTQKVIEEERHIRNQMEEIYILNQYNENLMESMQSGLLVAGSSGEAEFCNGYFLEALRIKRDDIIGQNALYSLQQHISIEIKSMEELIALKVIPGFLIHQNGNGKQKTYSLRVTPVYRDEKLEKVLLVLEDTTEVDRLWEENLLMDRVSSLSVLSAGMGHEINNPLASIQSHLDFLKAIEDNPDKMDSLKWIREGVIRISTIVSNTMDLMRPSGTDQSLKPFTIISETVEMLKRSVKNKEISFVLEDSSEGIGLDLPEDLFKQLILNLFLNSIDACSSGCTIRGVLEQSANSMVRFCLEDDGKGIPEDILPQIFNPFFSYGKEKKGSGLGLSICYGIVTRYGGTIDIRNREKQGTEVLVEMKPYDNTHS